MVLVLFKDPLLWWDGPLEIRVKRNEMKRVESRRNHVVSKCSLFLKWFWAWSHICLWNCDRCMVWNNFWQQSCQIFSLPAVECSDLIYVAGMYPEFENGEHMGSLKEQLWGNVRHWLSQTWRDQTLKTQHDKCSACHGFGHLGQSHWIFRCPRYANIIFVF